MDQRAVPQKFYRNPIALLCVLVLATAVVLGALHGRAVIDGLRNPRAISPPATAAKDPKVVSLVPAATDLLLAMNCGDHLVAVSNYESDPRVAHLPRVGDYQTTDWEKIVGLHPRVIITQYTPDRIPPGFVSRANAIGAQDLNIQPDTLEDKTAPGEPRHSIYGAIEALGNACNEPVKAAAAEAFIRARIDRVRHRTAGEPPVRALIVIGGDGTMVAGRDTYLTELLQAAGGINVAGEFTARYPMLDREQVLALKPDVVLQLMPSASPQVLEQARRFWASLPEVPAVKNGRVHQLTASYVLLPGFHIGDIAEQFANALHPQTVPGPTTTPGA
ncbi:MAG TPA: ABC transporter substrate-binding protein [Tepidisphaeraceae bacterium]|jgi:iron complex transport system substrate-binding protein|nr:ABC transporter substrate-binding protein [Tepidisphaeraceae bacterium]